MGAVVGGWVNGCGGVLPVGESGRGYRDDDGAGGFDGSRGDIGRAGEGQVIGVEGLVRCLMTTII